VGNCQHLCMCIRACLRACVHYACVRACVRTCLCVCASVNVAYASVFEFEDAPNILVKFVLTSTFVIWTDIVPIVVAQTSPKLKEAYEMLKKLGSDKEAGWGGGCRSGTKRIYSH